MKKAITTTQEALAWTEAFQRELLLEKRSAGEPLAPMRAKPGYELQFQRAERDLAAADFFLKLLEKERHYDQLRAMAKKPCRAARIADAAINFVVTFGLVSAAMLGLAAILALLRFHAVVVQLTAAFGVGAALRLTVRSTRQRRKQHELL